MDKLSISPDERNHKFLRKLQVRNVEVQACYQCGRCSAGCPVGDYFDINVMQAVRLAAYGQEERLLSSETIWLCAACETCATRCPNNIDITGLMDVLRELALRKGIEPAQPNIASFHKSFLGSIAHWGRAWEVGMIAAYKARSRDFLGDMGLGLKMFAKGKLKLIPYSISGKSEVKDIFTGKGKEYDR
jgi:heterodisulfide reductase subunit C2